MFDQVRPMVSHIEVSLPDKYLTTNNIGEALKDTQRQLWKEALFMQYENNKNVRLLLDPIPIKSFSEGKKNSSVHLLVQVLRKTTVMMHEMFLQATVQMGVLR